MNIPRSSSNSENTLDEEQGQLQDHPEPHHMEIPLTREVIQRTRQVLQDFMEKSKQSLHSNSKIRNPSSNHQTSQIIIPDASYLHEEGKYSLKRIKINHFGSNT